MPCHGNSSSRISRQNSDQFGILFDLNSSVGGWLQPTQDVSFVPTNLVNVALNNAASKQETTLPRKSSPNLVARLELLHTKGNYWPDMSRIPCPPAWSGSHRLLLPQIPATRGPPPRPSFSGARIIDVAQATTTRVSP